MKSRTGTRPLGRLRLPRRQIWSRVIGAYWVDKLPLLRVAPGSAGRRSCCFTGAASPRKTGRSMPAQATHHPTWTKAGDSEEKKKKPKGAARGGSYARQSTPVASPLSPGAGRAGKVAAKGGQKLRPGLGRRDGTNSTHPDCSE